MMLKERGKLIRDRVGSAKALVAQAPFIVRPSAAFFLAGKGRTARLGAAVKAVAGQSAE